MPAPSSKDQLIQALIDNGWNYEELAREPRYRRGDAPAPGVKVVAHSWTADISSGRHGVRDLQLIGEFDEVGRIAKGYNSSNLLYVDVGNRHRESDMTLGTALRRAVEYAPHRQLTSLQEAVASSEAQVIDQTAALQAAIAGLAERAGLTAEQVTSLLASAEDVTRVVGIQAQLSSTRSSQAYRQAMLDQVQGQA